MWSPAVPSQHLGPLPVAESGVGPGSLGVERPLLGVCISGKSRTQAVFPGTNQGCISEAHNVC